MSIEGVWAKLLVGGIGIAIGWLGCDIWWTLKLKRMREAGDKWVDEIVKAVDP